MRRYKLILWLLLIFSFSQSLHAQNTSNKGTDFWVAYSGHIDGLNSRLYLYITSDVNTTAAVKIGGVDIPGSPFIITANKVTPVLIDPNLLNVYLGASNVVEQNKAIQITAVKPVVVYSHIFRAARSASTLVLPTKVLGREYYVSAYAQNTSQSGTVTYSEFEIIAVEDNTTINITPKATDIANVRTANQMFTITLQKGEAYQYQSKTDLSGSHIISVAGANGSCKPIAVFSGSSWLGFCNATTASGNGGDNLYQQLYPVTSWGKEFITAPFINKPYDVFRIYFSKDNTTININGVPTSGTFNKGDFFEFNSSTPNRIVASEPVSLVQYQISQGCDPVNVGGGNNPAHPGDPEMTVLNPIEQTLSKITVYSALRDQTIPATQITQHFINVIIKDEFKSSFKINGLAPQSLFVPIGNSGYVYLQEDVTVRSATNPTHTLEADGGFSAIAYGYGPVESYGYLAGADVRNLFQNIEISSAGNTLETADICVGVSATFTLTLPYQTTGLIWSFDNQPQPAITTPVPTPVLKNGVTVYQYRYAQDLTYADADAGTHQVKVTSVNPNPSGCEANEEITLDFEVSELPEAAFSASTLTTCAGMPVVFSDQSVPKGKNIVKWHWDFGDGNRETKTSAAPFEHIFAAGGDYPVTLSVESEAGCESQLTVPVSIHINKVPEAKFRHTIACETKSITFTDESIANEGTINKWHWDFGDAANATAANPNTSTDKDPVHTFLAPGTYTVSLIVETDKGCTSIAFTTNIVVNRLPVVDFELPDVCLSEATAVFKNGSEDFDGSKTGLSYFWEFGDPVSAALNTSTQKDGTHVYSAAGDYTVTLTVTNGNSCSVTVVKTFTINGAFPTASFEVLNKADLCSNKEFLVKNTSTVYPGKVTRLVWLIDNVQVQEIIHPEFNAVYAFNYPAFTSPLTKSATLRLIAYSGGSTGDCNSILDEPLTFKAAPSVNFDALDPVCINGGQVQIVATETGNSIGTPVFSGPGITASGLFDPLSAGVGTHTITYRFTASNGCLDEKSQQITVFPAPTADAGQDLYILAGGEKRLTGKVSGSNVSFKWTPNTGLDRDDILNPLVKPEKDIEYTLTVISDEGCTVVDKVFVHVLENITIPNAFSPNGDGTNDVWNLQNFDSYPNGTVDIFNRYGEKVFHSKNYFIPFDGNYRNQPLPVGIYYYLINPGNGRKTISGPLTLIR